MLKTGAVLFAGLVLALTGCQSTMKNGGGGCAPAGCGASAKGCGMGGCGMGGCAAGGCGMGASQSAKYSNVVMVAFHADWCNTCKKIGPTVMDVSKNVGKMVKLDLTNDETKAASEKTVMELHACKAWKAEMPGTGFVVIFHKDRPDDYRKLKGSTDAAEYEKLFKEVN